MKLHNKQIGQRLAELRKTLSANSGVELSQTKLAQELDISQDAISRIENGTGSMDNLLKIFLYYHYKGFNILWVIIPENEEIPQYNHPKTDDTPINSEIKKTLEKLNNLLLKKYK